MKIDRNTNPDGTGKYALINLRTNQVQWGPPGDENEFFVLKLKDRHSLAALKAYADSVRHIDPEYCREIEDLMTRAGCNSQFCKDPD